MRRGWHETACVGDQRCGVLDVGPSGVVCWMSCQAPACHSLLHVTSDILSKWYCVTTWQSNVMLRRLSLFVLRHQVSLVHLSALLTTKTALSLHLSRQIRHIQSGTSQPKDQIISENSGYCAVSQYIWRLLCNQSVRHSSATEAN